MLIQVTASLALMLGATAAPPDSGRLTIDQAVRKVQKQTGGRILSADRVRSQHARKYRIKTLTDNGRVRVVEVDPKPAPAPAPPEPTRKPSTGEDD